MRAAEICRYRKDILSQTKRCLHSQVGEPPSLLHHRIHLLISDCARGLFANLLREPAYPWKALTALLFTAHSGSQSRNFPQRTLFPSHSTWFTSFCIGRRQKPEASQSHCSIPGAPTPCPLSLFRPQNPFFWAPLPLWCDLCTHWPGLGSCRGGGRPAHRGSAAPAAAEEYHRLRKKARLSATMSRATTYIDSVHLQVSRSKTTQKVSSIFTIFSFH